MVDELSERDWNAVAYDDLSEPMFEWGMAVLQTLELKGTERVLDAGCGSGRLTEELLARLPAGEVVALDFSPKMLEQARQRLAKFGERVEFVKAGLQEFELAQQVDGIFSNAVFHWVPDHRAMFRALHGALRPGAGWWRSSAEWATSPRLTVGRARSRPRNDSASRCETLRTGLTLRTQQARGSAWRPQAFG
jgi:ubiquinone/menaquinone biosynthesis C-methylase UbiE